MTKRLKSVNFFETESKSVATIAGLTVIKDVVIVQSGVDKVGDLMDDDFVKALVAEGNLAETGIKCRGGHPNMCKDSLGTYIGDYHNFRVIEDAGKVKAIADLYIADIAKKTQIDGKGISYHDYVVDMAKNHPDKFGNSIVFRASEEFVELDGKDVSKLTFEQLIASDIVDSPAATDGLFKSDEDLGVKLTDFLDENPELFEALEKNEGAIDIFLKKYANHLSHKKSNPMSLKDRIKSSIAKALNIETQKNIDVTDATGKILTVVTDAAEPQAGDEVQVDGGAAPDGEYTFPDGAKWSVAGGKIETITPAVAAPVDTPNDPQPQMLSEEAAKSLNEATEKIKSLEVELSESKKSLADFQKEVEEELAFIHKHIKSDYVPAVRQHTEKPIEKTSGRTKQVGDVVKKPK